MIAKTTVIKKEVPDPIVKDLISDKISDGVRKAREAYLIERGQTLEPLGLNRRDET